jgi:hypothetical protein
VTTLSNGFHLAASGKHQELLRSRLNIISSIPNGINIYEPPSFIVMHMLFFFLLAIFPVFIIADLKSDRKALLDFVANILQARKLNWNFALNRIERK